MSYRYKLTILTPTYNRKTELVRLYKSLLSQTNQNFQWLIIDDGSTDDTEEFIKTFTENQFALEYYKKKNGGKHTALNYSHPYIKGEIVCIVDSDDWLLPDAVQEILDVWENYAIYENVKSLCFLRGKSRYESIQKNFPTEPVISNEIDFRVNAARRGDCCEVLVTDVLKEHPFPEYEGERFLGEGYLWMYLGFRYDTVYINKVIYMCEYLEGGLTKSGRKLRIQCPYGGMANSNAYFEIVPTRKVCFKMLCKEAWLFICYGKFAGLNYRQIAERCRRKDLVRKHYLFGVLLYMYWKYKYQ